jgi:hypothetical protein
MCTGPCVRVFLTNYNTQLCEECGIETPVGPVPTSSGSCSVPLGLTYSRFHRVANILDQLFQPHYYGTPSSRVVCELLTQKKRFSTGVELLDWLSRLNVKNKKYQSAHYYFLICNRDYVVPRCPCPEQRHLVLRDFCILEDKFECMDHAYSSFFSYNWLLRKLLVRHHLGYYCQFIKTIKCPRRSRGYENMLSFFSVECNAGEVLGISRANQKLPDEPLDGACSNLQALLAFANRPKGIHPSTPRRVA